MCPAAVHTLREQESIILDAAARLVERTSLLDFTMSGLSKEAGLSVGSIYKHMQTKEDVLLSLNTEALMQRHGVYQRIFALPLSTPERLMGSSLFDCTIVNRTSFDDQLSMFVFNDAILNRGSERCVSRMLEWRFSIIGLFENLLRAAVTNSELRHEGDPQPLLDRLYSGLWFLNVGHRTVASQSRGHDESLSLVVGRESSLVGNLRLLINAFDWIEPLDDNGIERAFNALEKEGLR
jgi:AcrR family transcriptional regulator